jgi:cell division protein FtsL
MQKFPHRIEHAALSATRWIGSTQSLMGHTIAFVASFGAVLFGIFSIDRMLLVLTTVLSLEAIYLAIFIQMTVNRTTVSLKEVEQDIDEIQEDIDEIQEDVGEIQEDVEEMSEPEEPALRLPPDVTIAEIRVNLKKLMDDLERFESHSK